MRTFFWILLLANVTFFAAMQQGWLRVADVQEAQTQTALHGEKIRLLAMPQSAPPEASPAAAPAVVPVAIPVIAPVVSATVVAASAPLAVKPNGAACLEWGDFTGTDLTRATAALAGLKPGDKLSQRQIEHSIGYWVYIAPLKDKAAVNQKVAQLRARGVDEYFVVQEEGQWLNAISLGVFKTRESAQKFLDDLRAKDVRTAQIVERVSKLKATIFVLNGLDAATAARLTSIQKTFPGSELKSVACASAPP